MFLWGEREKEFNRVVFHASYCSPNFQRTVRFFNLCVLVVLVLLGWIETRFYIYWIFLTFWGQFLTTITILLLILAASYERRILQNASLDKSGYSESRSSFLGGHAALWKWATLMFEVSIVLEVIITLVYWTMLLPYVLDEDPPGYIMAK